MPHDTRQRAQAMLEAEGLAPATWSNLPHARYEPHAHDYDKVIVSVSGGIGFTLPELARSLLLDEGDRVELPAGTLHAAVVGPVGVTCLEAQVAPGTLHEGPRRLRRWACAPETAAAERS